MMQSLVQVAPLLQQMFATDVGIGITDREKFLLYLPGRELNFGVKPGDSIQDEAMKYTLSTGKRFENVVPEQAFGVPFRAIVVPVFEGRELVGCIGLSQSLRNEAQIQNITQQLTETMNQLVASSEEVSASADDSANRADHMAKEAVKVKEYVNSTNEILNMVKYIADRTRLIGLNAAIEAARAGEFGRSFSVVAEEVRKLADKSQQSVQEANEILGHLQGSIKELLNFINDIHSTTLNQAAASEQIAASTEEITAVIEELHGLANQL